MFTLVFNYYSSQVTFVKSENYSISAKIVLYHHVWTIVYSQLLCRKIKH